MYIYACVPLHPQAQKLETLRLSVHSQPYTYTHTRTDLPQTFMSLDNSETQKQTSSEDRRPTRHAEDALGDNVDESAPDFKVNRDTLSDTLDHTRTQTHTQDSGSIAENLSDDFVLSDVDTQDWKVCVCKYV